MTYSHSDEAAMKKDFMHSLIRGTTFVYIAESLTIIFAVLNSIVVARLLSPSDLGLLSIAGATIGIIGIWFNLGLETATIKYIAEYLTKNPAMVRKIMFSAVIIRSVTNVLLFVAVFTTADVISNIFSMPEVSIILKISSLGFLLGLINFIPSVTFIGAQKFEYLPILRFLGSFSSLIFTLLLLYLGYGAAGVIIAGLLGNLSTAVLGLRFAISLIPPSSSGKAFPFKKIFTYGIPLNVGEIIARFYDNIDRIILGLFLTAPEVGYYHLAKRWIDRPTGFIRQLDAVMMPTFSTLEGKKQRDLELTMLSEAVRYLAILACFICGIFVILGEDLITILYGERYLPAVPLLQIMIFMCIPRMITVPSMSLIKAIGITKYLPIGTAIFGLTHIVTVLALVSKYGTLGAAVAMSLTFCLVGFPIHLMVFKMTSSTARVSVTFPVKHLLKAFIASVIPLIPILFVNLTTLINRILLAVFYSSTYLIVLVKWGVLAKRDVKRLKQMIAGYLLHI